MRVKCLAQEHNAMTPARARTRAARPGDEHTNHEATTAPTHVGSHLALCTEPLTGNSKVSRLNLRVTPPKSRVGYSGGTVTIRPNTNSPCLASASCFFHAILCYVMYGITLTNYKLKLGIMYTA